MKLNRLRIDGDTSAKLSQLKARTGLTPNILCRIGFGLSLNDPTPPDLSVFAETDQNIDEKGVREIDRHTLTGQWDSLFVALLRERCYQDGLPLDDDTLAGQFKAHIYRGVVLLHKRTRTLSDLLQLMPKEARNA